MEVAQIGRGIVLQLAKGRWKQFEPILPKTEQIEAICFAHDLGHPPFGHSGETALNYVMRDQGGFEGNGQSLRIVSKLEPHTPDLGLNLTRRVMLGMLKYPAPYSLVKQTTQPKSDCLVAKEWKPPKCYLDSEAALIGWLLEPFSQHDQEQIAQLALRPTDSCRGKTAHRSLDASILDLADDIAYGVHDLEDGIALKLILPECFRDAIRPEMLEWADRFRLTRDDLVEQLFGPDARYGRRKLAIGSLINSLIASIEIHEVPEFTSSLLRFRARMAKEPLDFLDAVKNLIHDRIIKSQEVQTLEFQGREIVVDLFDAFMSDPESLLNEPFRKRLQRGECSHRVVCDYIAGMTDVFAARFHERLFGPRHGSVFEKL